MQTSDSRSRIPDTAQTKGLNREGVGARTVLASALLAMAGVWIALVATLVYDRSSSINDEQRDLERVVQMVEEQSRRLFSVVNFSLATIGGLLESTPDVERGGVGAINAVAEKLRAEMLESVKLATISDTGQIVPLPTFNETRSRPFGEVDPQSFPHDGKIYVGAPIREPATQARLIPFFRAAHTQSGNMILLAALVDAVELEAIYENARQKPNGSIGLVRQDGTVLARSPRGSELAGHSIARGTLWKEHLPGSPRGTVILPRTAIDGEERLTSYALIPGTGLVAIASTSMDDLRWQWWRNASLLLAIGLAVTVVLAFGAKRMLALVAELSRTKQRAEEQALQDALTGLPNRRMFLDRLELEIKRAERSSRRLALFFIDLDLFKEVNDTLGHSIGDLLLQRTAERLRECIRATDVVARLGGDEFTVVLTDIDSEASIDVIAEKMMNRLAEVYQLDHENVYVSASVGITIYPDDGTRISELLKQADQAMYSAKGEGRNRRKYFTQSMQEAMQDRMRVLADLRTALREKQFKLWYQPIFELASGRVHKAEALLRWQHPTRGMVSPTSFIGVAEQSEIIAEIGDWVFREAVSVLGHWRQVIHPEFQVSVNKSPAQFRYRHACALDWVSALEAAGLPGSSLIVEITENLLLDASETTVAQLKQFSLSQIQLSLDDFGTGYSSLSYLQNFDLDYLKIDRSFVSNLGSQSQALALCEAIIVMAHKLGLKVVAEGIETEAQAALLTSLGCDYGQGFFFSAAVAPEEFERFAQKANAG